MATNEQGDSEGITISDVILKSNTSGLTNNGATCYVNTAVQCLGFCTPFFKYILVGDSPKDHTPLTDELREIYMQLWVHKNGIAPHKFLRSLQRTLGSFINIFEQNDITEFLMLYIDKLNTDLGVEIKVEADELIEMKKKIFTAYKSNKQFQNLAYDMEMAWLNNIKKEYSPVMDIFYGQLVSQVVCGNCKHIHHNYEVYSSLSLPLVNTKVDQTYEDLLQAYFAREYINTNDYDMGWKCDNCKESVKSPKCLKLYRTPMVLIVTLKRFNATLNKSNAKVSMPFDLDLSRYSLRDGGCKYSLSAVAHHQGGLGSGHYNCICHHKKGTWLAIDDVLVREASSNEIDHVMNYGYVYFYERV
jgi:ubiquitin C-terminal hydrolase